MGNYTGPWAITFNPFLIAQAGSPYNITSPYDLTGDNFFNDRPSYSGSSAAANNTVQTSFGTLDVVPQSGEPCFPISHRQQPGLGCRQPARRAAHSGSVPRWRFCHWRILRAALPEAGHHRRPPRRRTRRRRLGGGPAAALADAAGGGGMRGGASASIEEVLR